MSTTIVKVGSNVLAKSDGNLNEVIITQLAGQIKTLQQKGRRVVLISSGAIAAGRSLVQKPQAVNEVALRQFHSAIGQTALMSKYKAIFAEQNLFCAQVLATKEDFRDRSHYLNMRQCISVLLDNGVVPIMNENDAIAVTELMFTDNDELASLVATMLNADQLCILTNVDGLYDRNPEDPAAKVLHQIDAHADLAEYIAPTKSSFGRGGMLTKAKMAQKTARLGVPVYLLNGCTKNVLNKALIDQVEIGTKISAEKPDLSNQKRWVGQSEAYAQGSITLDAGATKVVVEPEKIASILPVGITSVSGEFASGDIIAVKNPLNEIIAYGRSEYSAETGRQLIGKQQQKPFIHYNYLLVL